MRGIKIQKTKEANAERGERERIWRCERSEKQIKDPAEKE